MKGEDNMNLSDNLKKIRKEHNLSQEQLAERLGVSRQSVSKWESSQAYPEMDKMLQLCQMFNLNMDDLLNQDIKEVNNVKQAKNNINKFIDDFLDYITKTIDMFSGMKLKEKIKCIFEQITIVGIITIALFIIGVFGYNIFGSLFSFLPFHIYNPIYHIFKAIYFACSFILVIVLVFHIFKVRYLDYYIIVKENTYDKETDDSKVEINEKAEPPKILLEKKKEKIIIRDPEHSGYKFIYGLLRCLLFIVKAVTSLIAFTFCLTLIVLVVCLVISFVFIKTGMLFIGVLMCLLSAISINLTLIIILYNFIISKKTKKSKIFLIFMISLLVLGCGIGTLLLGITKFDVIDDMNSEYYISSEKTLQMNDDLYFENYFGKIEYIESDNSNIRIIIKHSANYVVKMESYGTGYSFHHYLPSSNMMKAIRDNIDDINDQKIINYQNYKIYIYTTKENIQLLRNNLYKHYQEEVDNQQLINEYENMIDNLREVIEEQESRIDELENSCNSGKTEE